MSGLFIFIRWRSLFLNSSILHRLPFIARFLTLFILSFHCVFTFNMNFTDFSNFYSFVELFMGTNENENKFDIFGMCLCLSQIDAYYTNTVIFIETILRSLFISFSLWWNKRIYRTRSKLTWRIKTELRWRILFVYTILLTLFSVQTRAEL